MDETSTEAAWQSAADGTMDDALGRVRGHLDQLVAEAVEWLKEEGEEYRPLERLPEVIERAVLDAAFPFLHGNAAFLSDEEV